jgi:hypothetical protein
MNHGTQGLESRDFSSETRHAHRRRNTIRSSVQVRPTQTVGAGPGGLWQRESVLPGWNVGRLWRLSLILCCVLAACDAASGPHLILIGLLIAGPCCALLTARWALTAAASGVAVALGILLGLPDQIFATVTQYAFVAAVAVVGRTATAGAAVLQNKGH